MDFDVNNFIDEEMKNRLSSRHGLMNNQDQDEEEEKKQILKDAEKLYESNVEEQVNEVYSNQNVDGKLLKFNFFNMFKFVFLQLVQDKKERVFDERRREYVTKKTTSCTASIPAGPNNKAMYLYAYFRNDGILLMNLFKSYKFGREDIKKIKLTSSNSKQTTYKVDLLSGHTVLLQVIPKRESNILRLFGDMLSE